MDTHDGHLLPGAQPFLAKIIAEWSALSTQKISFLANWWIPHQGQQQTCLHCLKVHHTKVITHFYVYPSSELICHQSCPDLHPTYVCYIDDLLSIMHTTFAKNGNPEGTIPQFTICNSCFSANPWNNGPPGQHGTNFCKRYEWDVGYAVFSVLTTSWPYLRDQLQLPPVATTWNTISMWLSAIATTRLGYDVSLPNKPKLVLRMHEIIVLFLMARYPTSFGPHTETRHIAPSTPLTQLPSQLDHNQTVQYIDNIQTSLSALRKSHQLHPSHFTAPVVGNPLFRLTTL
jgi:hypothetical protein